MATLEMKVWVGCLVCYNDGRLNGQWLDAADAEDFACDRAGHEEMWCMDTDGMPVNKEMSPSTARKWAELWAETFENEALGAYIRYHGITDPEEVNLQDFDDAKAGEASGHGDHDIEFAQEYWESTRDDDPSDVWPYTCIDWEWAARELLHGFYSERMDGVTYYFHNN